MICVLYWRCEAKVTDLRTFSDDAEFTDWFRRQLKLEPTAIIGIYDRETELKEMEADRERFMMYVNHEG